MNWKSWEDEKPKASDQWKQFIWITYAQCWCCIDCFGIGYVTTMTDKENLNPDIYYKLDDGTFIWWEAGDKPFYPYKDGKPFIHCWAYCDAEMPAIDMDGKLNGT